MITNTTQDLECHGNESLVIDGFGEFQVSKVAGIALLMDATEARIIDTPINSLTLNGGLVARDSGGHLTAADRNRLRNTVLPLALSKYFDEVERERQVKYKNKNSRKSLNTIQHFERTNSVGLTMPNCNCVIRRKRTAE
jgi:hypothetical protein